ncbi:hypothetical protein PO909_031010, partial [Leuciscus waleckii]
SRGSCTQTTNAPIQQHLTLKSSSLDIANSPVRSCKRPEEGYTLPFVCRSGCRLVIHPFAAGYKIFSAINGQKSIEDIMWQTVESCITIRTEKKVTYRQKKALGGSSWRWTQLSILLLVLKVDRLLAFCLMSI